MPNTKKNTKSETKFAEWSFGIYRAPDKNLARLGIAFPAAEGGDRRLLFLDAAQIKKPVLVMEALFNAGAVIDLAKDEDAFSNALRDNLIKHGRLVTKLGVNDKSFVMPNAVYGPPLGPYQIDDVIHDRATPFFASKGTLTDWQATVLELSSQSSFLMFVIMMALAAPLLEHATSGADEGFLINLAGDTSRGKTTALMVGKSVSGAPGTKLTWVNTDRAFVELAGALSDTLMAIDDLDKISRKSDFGAYFSGMTHLLTSGVSKGYAAMVQKQLPNMSWTFCGITCARATIDELSSSSGHLREGHERVRCFDLQVPGPEVGGIWDRREDNEDPAGLTAQMQEYLRITYGTALPAWLELIYNDETSVQDVRELIEHFQALVEVDPSDGLSHRVAKKFGLIYAAAILAEEHDFVPWSRDDIEGVVTGFFHEAAENLHTVETEVKRGFERLRQHLLDSGIIPQFGSNMRPTFEDSEHATAFKVKDGYTTQLCLRHSAFATFFVNPGVTKAAMDSLKRHEVVISPGAQKRIELMRPKRRTVKPRYVVLNYTLLEKTLKTQQA